MRIVVILIARHRRAPPSALEIGRLRLGARLLGMAVNATVFYVLLTPAQLRRRVGLEPFGWLHVRKLHIRHDNHCGGGKSKGNHGPAKKFELDFHEPASPAEVTDAQAACRSCTKTDPTHLTPY